MEPYSDDEIADARTHLSCDDESDRCHYHDVAHWLATVDALRARLAAAEAERNEWKDIASVFLAATEPNQPIPVQGQIMLAQVRERARATFDAHLASRPEGEVRDGR